MEKIIMQIKQIEHDRVVFVSYSENKIIGINFHQGCDQVDWSFKNPCPVLSKILEMFLENENLKTEEDKINRAIELYCNFFIFQDIEKSKVIIPSAQLDLIKKALNYYIEQSEKFNITPNDIEAYEKFDMQTLSAMMNYEISISISDADKYWFASKNGIDFPTY
jgi:hypothetical protein